MVLPLIDGDLKINHFIGDSLFSSDANQILYITYNKKILTLSPDSLLRFPDTTVVNSFTNIFPFTINPGQSISFLPPGETTFDLSGDTKLKTAIIRSGKLKLFFSNFVSQPIDLIYKIPSATLYGIPYSLTVTVPTGSNSVFREIDLKGYELKLNGISGVDVYNSIYQTYTVSLNPNAQATVAPTGTFAQIAAKYEKLVPQYMEGYFGNQSVSFGPDTIYLDIFKNFGVQNFSLSAAKVEFTILNNFGADFKGKIDKFIALKGNQSASLSASAIQNININRATRANDQPVPSVKNISINESNSNITSFLSLLPSKISYMGSVLTNPMGNVSGFQDFLYYSKGIDLRANISIPLKFNADAFYLSSDIEVNLSSLNQMKNIKDGGLKLYISNGYPFDVILQAYLLDQNKKVLDSLLSTGNNMVKKGILNSQNEVVEAENSLIFVPLNQDIIDKMLQSKYIRLKTKLLMPPQPPEITIRSYYTLRVKIIADVVFNVKRK